MEAVAIGGVVMLASLTLMNIYSDGQAPSRRAEAGLRLREVEAKELRAQAAVAQVQAVKKLELAVQMLDDEMKEQRLKGSVEKGGSSSA